MLFFWCYYDILFYHITQLLKIRIQGFPFTSSNHLAKVYHLPSPWFTCLHFDLCDTDPSCYDQMTILERYIFWHKTSINNVITLLFHLFKKMVHHIHFTSLVCEFSIFIWSHQRAFNLCASHQIVIHVLFVSWGAVTTKTSPTIKIMYINQLYVRYSEIYK